MDACNPPSEADMAQLRELGAPDLKVTWEVAERDDPTRMNALLDILFRPHGRPNAA